MKVLVLKAVLGLGFLFAAGASFAQDGVLVGIVIGVSCPDGWCSCTNGLIGDKASQCCGKNTCTLQGIICTCT